MPTTSKLRSLCVLQALISLAVLSACGSSDDAGADAASHDLDAGPRAGDAAPPADDATPPADDATPPADDAAPPADDAGPPAGDAGLNCSDHAMDGDESDVDCGGSCSRCAVGQMCRVASDCVSGVCSTTCQPHPTGGLEVLTTFRVLQMIETSDPAIFAADGSHLLQVSTDNGVTWGAVPGASFSVASLAVNAHGELLVGTHEVGSTLPTAYVCSPTGCIASSGISTLGGTRNAITSFTTDSSGTVYASDTHSDHVHRSNDHGRTWTTLIATMPATIGQAYTIHANASGLWLGGEIGSILQSTDGGMTWVDRGLTRPTYHGNLWVIDDDPRTGNMLAAVGDDVGVGTDSMQLHLASDPLGVWHGTTGTSYEQVSGWAFQSDGSILAGAIQSTSGVGEVFKSTDGGSTWVDISSSIGPALRGLVRLHIGPSGCLYLSHGDGLLRNCSGY